MEAQGWRKKDGKPVLNVDLMQAIDRAITGRRVRFEWVRAAGHPLNEQADRLANGAAAAYQAGRVPDAGPGFGDRVVPSPVRRHREQSVSPRVPPPSITAHHDTLW